MKYLALLFFLVLLSPLAGCGSVEQPARSGAREPTPLATAGRLTPVIASSELTVGRNRFTLGLLRENTPVEDATVHLRFFKIEGDTATLTEEADAPYYGYGLQGKGVYVAHPTFDRPGDWGVEVQARLPDGATQILRSRFTVQAEGRVPRVGEQAPSVPTPTEAQVADLKTITSDPQPDPRLYQISLDQALAQGRPVALIFATPGYCSSAVCGPDLDVIKQLADTYGGRIAFIHVEVYKDPLNRVLADPMVAWNLETEPWLFLIDKQGIIRARYEGGITRQEVEPDVRRLLGE
ncbi:MAG: thiol reductase thioredoxin [Herpetosiphonaceae bacterium]|nr:MAG: thiol reductase thioredoxin [Herpetosiphonaceae bacterium]